MNSTGLIWQLPVLVKSYKLRYIINICSRHVCNFAHYMPINGFLKFISMRSPFVFPRQFISNAKKTIY